MYMRNMATRMTIVNGGHLTDVGEVEPIKGEGYPLDQIFHQLKDVLSDMLDSSDKFNKNLFTIEIEDDDGFYLSFGYIRDDDVWRA